MSKDIITSYGQSLYIQFGRTGELQQATTLDTSRGLTFCLEGTNIEAHYHDVSSSPGRIVEHFASAPLAAAAFDNLKAALACHASARRAAGYLKAFVKWVVAPLVIVVFALAINAGVTRSPGVMQPHDAALPLQTPGPVAPAPASAAPSRQAVAAALAEGAQSGKYAVQLSKGTKGTLYVFSDPLCPHCQDLEPELDKLAKDYTIYVFPVAIIGGATSVDRTVKLMCAKQDSRPALWKQLAKGEDIGGDVCLAGADVVERNDKVFLGMRLTGTPTIFNGAGEQSPNDVPNTALGLDQWMSAAAQGK
ncbi:Thiol:disulfide interchange protein [Burkholderia diffusa]|uniref:DsbC family protein n=1 Tax=Burkholderia diffusa TaxID=488732 RepID=UPI001CAD1CEF|nr:DsbC family protein [Burkholderia diffusa]CAG9260954.1 Thiol:disulfide interchange protein [Burkholderia diffusa]